jgi:cytochrome c
MKNKMKILRNITFISLVSVVNLFASVEADVEALVNKAFDYCKTEGLEVCTKAFTNKDPEFTKGSLYIFVGESNGPLLAHGGNAKLVGRDLSNIKSASGVYPGKEFSKAMNSGKDSLWIQYKWSHPVTKKIADKLTYIKKFNDKIYIGSGYYK